MGRRLVPTIVAVTAAVLLIAPQAGFAGTQPQARDLTQLFCDGVGGVDGLLVYEVGGIVVIRGRVTDNANTERASAFARANGFTRIANLVQIVEPVSDAAIERAAERELSMHRGLDGCRFRVASRDGVLHLAGHVERELQIDMAIHLVHHIDGVKEVRADFSR